MRIRVGKLLKIYDEYVYKIIFVIVGLLYWVYGMTRYIDFAFSILLLASIIPMSINMVKIRKADFRRILALLSLFFGIGTILFCANKRGTTTALIYTIIKMLVLAYCSKEKENIELERELINIFRIIAVIGTIILIISLVTYFSGVSISYLNSTSHDATTLYVGRNPGGGGMCGILANGNIVFLQKIL